MIPDREFIRMGLEALGYTTRHINITGAAWGASKDGVPPPAPRFVAVGHRGAITLTIGCNVRRGTSKERYHLKQVGELSHYNGITAKQPFPWGAK